VGQAASVRPARRSNKVPAVALAGPSKAAGVRAAERVRGLKPASRADSEGRKGDRKKALWLAKVRAEADKLVAWVEAAYAKTRPPPKRDEGGDERQDEAHRERDREHRGHYAGRTDEAGRVVFATPRTKAVRG
jgi:hypothetical protein